ncbi:MAG: molybdopterin converting factor subunit 1 [Pseudomonadota bacterium]
MIRVKCFASVREEMGVDELVLPLPRTDATVADVLQALQAQTGKSLAQAHLLAAVNMTHAAMDVPVQDGDEVAFFPPVTGGGA